VVLILDSLGQSERSAPGMKGQVWHFFGRILARRSQESLARGLNGARKRWSPSGCRIGFQPVSGPLRPTAARRILKKRIPLAGSPLEPGDRLEAYPTPAGTPPLSSAVQPRAKSSWPFGPKTRHQLHPSVRQMSWPIRVALAPATDTDSEEARKLLTELVHVFGRPIRSLLNLGRNGYLPIT
jgi:hypothetical protein